MVKHKLKQVCVVAFILGAFAAIPAWAQYSTASINGIVRDESGAVVPQASITLRNTETGVERRSVSNTSGNYVFLDILPGTYTLEASKEGFVSSKILPFALAVNQTATFDFALNVGSLQQTVTVEAVGVEVQGSTAELGAVIGRQRVVDLPLNGRNFTQLLTLVPGASDVNVSQNATGGQTSPVGAFTFPSINGQTNRSNFYMLDGVPNQGVVFSNYAVPPIVDAIQEFKVQSHNDQLEFGGVLGGFVNVVTKQGTNDFHGALWEYLRNDALDARDFFLARVTPFKQNMFGVSAGGPVLLPKLYNGKNKTFFYLGYEGFRKRQPNAQYYNVPTAANFAGDLSNVARQIYDPMTTRQDPAQPGTFLRDPFPGNRLPAGRLSAGMVLYAKSTVPEATQTSLPGFNALDLTPSTNNQDAYTARLDQVVGEKDFFWFRYSGTIQDVGSGRRQLPSVLHYEAKNLGGSWVRTIGQNSVIQAQLGHTLLQNNTWANFKGVPATFASQVGFADDFASHYYGGVTLVPAMNVADYFSGGETSHFGKNADIWQTRVNYSRIHGNHTFRMGGDFASNGYGSNQRTANATFATFDTSDPKNSAKTGSSLASFLLNVPSSATRRNVVESTEFGGVMGFYFQDQWKATSRLTVNIGLRYDRTFIPTYGRDSDRNNMVGNLDLNRGVYVLQKAAPPCGGGNLAPCIPGGVLPEHVEVSKDGRILRDPLKNFQPRLGLAYRLGPRTAIRGSFGVFFDNWSGIWQTAREWAGSWPSVGFISLSNLNNPKATQPTPAVNAFQPLPAGVMPAASPFGQVVFFADPNYMNGYSLQWNFGLQHQLSSSTLVSANYVGSGSRRLDLGGIYNTALTPGPGTPMSRALYPYIQPTFYNRSWGRSNYNSLQLMLDRSFSKSLAAMVSYTWAKSIDIGCSGWYGVEGCAV